MVYPGKPSTGCQTCRSRHIKCDETRPHCNACVRSGRECPGYPHPLDVMLRGQIAFTRKSGNTSLKAPYYTKGDYVSSKTESLNSTLSCLPCFPQNPATLGPVLPPQIPGGLYLPMEDTLTGIFFNSYIYAPRDPLVRMGALEVLPQLYGAAPFDSHLRLSALAVAAFSVAAWTRQEHLLQFAQQCFVRALPRIRQALQVDIEQTFDDILMTALLLSIYEEFIAVKESRPSTKAHLRGAIALITSHRPKCPNSPLSDTLTYAVQSEIINVTVEGTYPSPLIPDIWPLSLSMPQLASSRLTNINTAVVRLRDRWVQCSASMDATHLKEFQVILSEARYIDGQLVAWTQSLPQHWDPVPASFISQSIRDLGIYQDRCDCYSDFWVAQTWNRYRSSRLVLQKIILRCLYQLSGDAVEIESITTMIRALATDICATVPFYLGDQTGSGLFNASRVEYPVAETRLIGATHRQTAPLLGGWFIISPLESLCSEETLPEDQVNWVKGQLQRILRIYTSGL